MLDEHLLHEPVRFLHIVVVMSLTHVANLRELIDAELPPALAERLEHVFRLTTHDDIGDEPQVIALPRRIGEIFRHSQRGAGNAFERTAKILERSSLGARTSAGDQPLKFFEHALVFAHSRNVSRAEITITLILSLGFMIHDRSQERIVLHDCIVDLTPQEIDSSLHQRALDWGPGAEVHNTRQLQWDSWNRNGPFPLLRAHQRAPAAGARRTRQEAERAAELRDLPARSGSHA